MSRPTLRIFTAYSDVPSNAGLRSLTFRLASMRGTFLGPSLMLTSYITVFPGETGPYALPFPRYQTASSETILNFEQFPVEVVDDFLSRREGLTPLELPLLTARFAAQVRVGEEAIKCLLASASPLSDLEKDLFKTAPMLFDGFLLA